MSSRTPLLGGFDLLAAAATAVAAGVLGVPLLLCPLAAIGVLAVCATVAWVRRPAPIRPPAPVPIPPASAEGGLLERGRAAATAFAEISTGLPAGLLGSRADDMRRQAQLASESLAALARQTATVTRLLGQLSGPGLRDERDAIRRRLARAEGRERSDLSQSLAALETRSDAGRNLTATRTALLSRMAMVTYGLEGLVARLAELVALAEAGSLAAGDDRIDRLTLELEGLRHGMVEAENLGTIAAEFAAEEEK